MTVRLLVVNADFNAGYNKALIAQCCDWCDVLALVEAKDFTVADFLPAGWTSLQDTSSEAEAGSCLAVNGAKVSVAESYLILGCDEPKGGGMLRRYLAVAECHEVATGKQFAPIADHWPAGPLSGRLWPPVHPEPSGRVGQQQDPPPSRSDAMRTCRSPRWPASLQNAKGYGTEVMGWCVWKGETIKVTDTVVRGGVEAEGWSDHPGYQDQPGPRMTNPVPGYPVSTAYKKRGPYWSCDEDSAGNGVHTGQDYAAPAGDPGGRRPPRHRAACEPRFSVRQPPGWRSWPATGRPTSTPTCGAGPRPARRSRPATRSDRSAPKATSPAHTSISSGTPPGTPGGPVRSTATR